MDIDSYIDHLLDLIDLERRAQKNSMIEEIKELTAEEREKAGRTITNMEGRFKKIELSDQIYQFSFQHLVETEIKVGSRVIISDGDPSKNRILGNVTEKRKHRILVSFFNQEVPEWVENIGIRMDLYVDNTTFDRMEKNLNELSEYGQNAIYYSLNREYIPNIKNTDLIFYQDFTLDDFQKKAIDKCLSTQDFFLIHGPFGTGKTKTLIELIMQEVIRNNKVLVTAESNAAVDNIVERLYDMYDLNITRVGYPQKVSEKILSTTHIHKIENHKLNKKIKEYEIKKNNLIREMKNYTVPNAKNRQGLSDNTILIHAESNTTKNNIPIEKMKSMATYIKKQQKVDEYKKKIKKLENEIIKDILRKSQVILTTNSTSASDILKDETFDVAIIDESSQTVIPSVLIPISKAERFILAGDHKQLPPTVKSDEAKMELEITLFEKLMELYPEKKVLLNMQYRMNEILMEFPNLEFYNGELKCYDKVKNISLSCIGQKYDKDSPLIFIDTSNLKNNYEYQYPSSKSKINRLEAKIALDITNDFIDLGISPDNIGIISFYADQINLIKKRINVEVKTVDGFQGREKDLIIISTVRSNKNNNIGFISDLRRINVAITRAKKKLIIIGNINTLKHDETYNKLIKYCKKHDAIISAK